jgi:hypothetical protein
MLKFYLLPTKCNGSHIPEIIFTLCIPGILAFLGRAKRRKGKKNEHKSLRRKSFQAKSTENETFPSRIEAPCSF